MWSIASLKRIPQLFPVSYAHIFARGRTHTSVSLTIFRDIVSARVVCGQPHKVTPTNCEQNPFGLAPPFQFSEFKNKYAKTKNKQKTNKTQTKSIDVNWVPC